MAILVMLGLTAGPGIGRTLAGDATPIVPTATVTPPTPTTTPASPPSPFCVRDDVYSTASNRILSVSAPGVFANEAGAVDLVSVGPAAHGTVDLKADGSFTYIAYAGFTGTDAFVYEVNCRGGKSHQYGTVTITVEAPASTCIALDDFYSVDKKGTLYVPDPGVLKNDIIDSGSISSILSAPTAAHGRLTWWLSGFQYTPDPSFVGFEKLTYTLWCVPMSGPSVFAQATLTIAVGMPPVTPSPSCNVANDSYTMTSGTSLSVPAPGVFANDSYPNPYELDSVSTPMNGTSTIGRDGALIYTPNSGFTGTDTFTYAVKCGTGDVFHIERATVSITVRPVSTPLPTSVPMTPTVVPTATTVPPTTVPCGTVDSVATSTRNHPVPKPTGTVIDCRNDLSAVAKE